MVQPEPSTNPPVVLITGGTGGIGATVAEAFASAGADVIATGIDNDELTAFGQSYPHIRCFKLDVTRDDSVAQVVHGLKRLSVLVNAAGILLREGKEYTLPAFDQVLDVNLSGVMRVSLACRDLLARESGCIVNVASMLSYFGSGFVPAYSASKGGVAQLTRSLAIGWAPLGIRVNAVAGMDPHSDDPGTVRGCFAQPSDPRPHAVGPVGRTAGCRGSRDVPLFAGRPFYHRCTVAHRWRILGRVKYAASDFGLVRC